MPDAHNPAPAAPPPNKRKYCDASILIFINFMYHCNFVFMGATFKDLQKYFEINDEVRTLLRLAFVLPSMFSSPVFGYLTDRFSRKYLVALGVGVWSFSNLCASFAPKLWLFLVMVALAALGEACVNVVAPTLLSDLFVGDMRSRLLCVYYLTRPVSIGIKFLVRTLAPILFSNWMWCLRLLVVVGVVNMVLALVMLHEPARGELDGRQMEVTMFDEDLKYLLRNRSYLITTLALSAVRYCTGTLGLWFSPLLYKGLKIKYPDIEPHSVYSSNDLMFFLGGSLGLLVAYLISRNVKETYPRGDPMICSMGVLAAMPFIFLATELTYTDKYATYGVLFLGFFFLSMIWAITTDICLGVVVPSRRGSAIGIMLFATNALGHAWSSEITRLVAAGLTRYYDRKEKNPSNDVYAIQHAVLLTLLVAIVGGILYFVASLFIADDLKKAKGDATE